MSEPIKSFEDCVEYRKHLTNIMKDLKRVCDADEKCRRRFVAFAERRGLPVEFFDEHGIFYLSAEMAKKYDEKKKVRQPDDVCVPKKEERDTENLWRTKSRKVFRFLGATISYNGKSRNILEDRVIYPLYSYITDENNGPLVCGVCGYDMSDDALAKYIYCQTPYFDRVGYLYGEEQFLSIMETKVFFMAEGLVDKLWLEYAMREAGIEFITLATCGVTSHDIKLSKLGLMCDYAHLYYFPDRDKSGEKLADIFVKRYGNKVTLCYVKLGNKDVADYFSGRHSSCDFSAFRTLLSNTQDGMTGGATYQV